MGLEKLNKEIWELLKLFAMIVAFILLASFLVGVIVGVMELWTG